MQCAANCNEDHFHQDDHDVGDDDVDADGDVDHADDVGADDEALLQQADGLAKCIPLILQYLSTCKTSRCKNKCSTSGQI